jgi:hypothetical protein
MTTAHQRLSRGGVDAVKMNSRSSQQPGRLIPDAAAACTKASGIERVRAEHACACELHGGSEEPDMQRSALGRASFCTGSGSRSGSADRAGRSFGGYIECMPI